MYWQLRNSMRQNSYENCKLYYIKKEATSNIFHTRKCHRIMAFYSVRYGVLDDMGWWANTIDPFWLINHELAAFIQLVPSAEFVGMADDVRFI